MTELTHPEAERRPATTICAPERCPACPLRLICAAVQARQEMQAALASMEATERC